MKRRLKRSSKWCQRWQTSNLHSLKKIWILKIQIMKRLKPIVVNLAQKKKKTRIKIQSKQQRLKQYKFNMLMKMMESPLQLSEYWVNDQKFLLMKTSLSSTGFQSSMKHCLILNMDEQRWKLGKKSSRVYSKVEL